MSKRIPFLSLEPQLKELRQETLAATATVYSEGSFILGKQVAAFEKKYASYNGVKFCIGTGNGYDAIYLSLRALGIGKGNEVIVPSNTCIPTWLAVTATGARVVPVEPDIHTFNIDPAKIAAAITSATRAIVPVHLYGQACSMDEIMRITEANKIRVVEDNAQAHGARFGDRRTGSFGVINATSFYPTKNLGAPGDAGAITTNDSVLYEKVKALRNYGSDERNIFEERGVNSRLDELHAAVLLAKLKKLDRWNNQRKAIAKTYLKELKSIEELDLPVTAEKATHVFHLFVVRTTLRDDLAEYLRTQGIGTLIHYPSPPHMQKAYSDHGFKKDQFPIANEISNTCLSLPCWPGMRPAEIEAVIESIHKFFKHGKSTK